MSHCHSSAAVCIVRAERQGTGLLITLLINSDIEGSTSSWSQQMTDIDAAVAAIRRFLVTLAQNQEP
jgi:hypothetical protein